MPDRITPKETEFIKENMQNQETCFYNDGMEKFRDQENNRLLFLHKKSNGKKRKHAKSFWRDLKMNILAALEDRLRLYLHEYVRLEIEKYKEKMKKQQINKSGISSSNANDTQTETESQRRGETLRVIKKFNRKGQANLNDLLDYYTKDKLAKETEKSFVNDFKKQYRSLYFENHKNICIVVTDDEKTKQALKKIIETRFTQTGEYLFENNKKYLSIGNTDIVLCNHLEVDARQDDPLLTNTGMTQANAIGEKIREIYFNKYKDINLNIFLFASDMRKTQHTALILAKAIVPPSIFEKKQLYKLLRRFNGDPILKKRGKPISKTGTKTIKN